MMTGINSLPQKNLRRKPMRTCALMALVAFLAFSVFSGAVIVLSLQSGLRNLEARLGADVIVVPASAKSKVNVDNILLNATTGFFYMDRTILDQVSAIDGIEKASPQVFLTSLRADCCTMPVQVIGIDQATDFVIGPWMTTRYQGTLSEMDVVVGSKVDAEVGSKIRIYNENCNVVARLDSTGTGLDTAVYTNMDTIHRLMEASEAQDGVLKITGSPEEVISAIYIKVKDGHSAESVTNAINVHVRKVQAVQTKNMLTGVSDSLGGIASTAAWLIAAICVLTFAILMVAFCLLINERKREFAVLRMVGASRLMLLRIIIVEAMYLSLAGGVLGTVLGAAVVFPFNALIEMKLGLPFLIPSLWSTLLVAAITLILALSSGSLASAFAARRLSRIETGAVLREGN